MSRGPQSSFVLWLVEEAPPPQPEAERFLEPEQQTRPPEVGDQIAEALREQDLALEVIDVHALARAGYNPNLPGSRPPDLGLAVGMTARALNRHGVAVLIQGARGHAASFRWGKRKPERLLEIDTRSEAEAEGSSGVARMHLPPKTEKDGSRHWPVEQLVASLQRAGWLG